MSKQKVIDIVKTYVSRCGGSVPLEYLLQDYKISYKCELPYAEFGYVSAIDFLDTLSEVSLVEEDGITYVESFEFNLKKRELSDQELDPLDDFCQLSVQMKNNLLLDCQESPRVVKIQSSSNVNTNYRKFLNRNNSSLSNRSEETVGDKSLSSGSMHSLNTAGLSGNEYTPDVDSVSAYNYPCENYSSAVSDYRNSYEDVYPSNAYQSTSAASRISPSSVADSYRHTSTIKGVSEFDDVYPPRPDAYQSSFITNDEENPRKNSLDALKTTNIYRSDSLYAPPPPQPSDGFAKLPDDYSLQNSYTSGAYRSLILNGKVSELPDSQYFDKKTQNGYAPDEYHSPPSPGSVYFHKTPQNSYASDVYVSPPPPGSVHFDKKPQNVYLPHEYNSPPPPGSVYFEKNPQNGYEYKSPPSPGKVPGLPDVYFPDRTLQSRDIGVSNTYQSQSYNYPINMRPQNNNVADWIPELGYKPPFPGNWPLRITDEEIVNRIVKVVNSQTQTGGIDSLTMELKYSEMYSTSLPKHWLNLLEESFMLYVEKLSPGIIIHPNRWYPTAPTSSSLPAVRYPDIRNCWNIIVTSYENTACVWFRLMDEDFDLKYDNLRQGMSKYYRRLLENMKHLTEVTDGQLCAIHYRNEWYRGEVSEHDSQNKSVRCSLIDVGILHNFPLSKIFELDEKFTNTPALAIQGVLNGLEKWENCNFINCKLQRLLSEDKEIKIKVDKFLDSHRVTMQVLVEQNSQLVKLNFKIIETARKELNLPVLYSDEMYDVIVLSVHENNSAQIQLQSPSLTLLEKTLQKVADLMKNDTNLEQVRIQTMFDLKLDKIYIARCENGQWRRIVCRQFHLSNKVSALFIDYAEVKIVYLHDIFDTGIFSDTVSFIQPQAVLVKMMDIDGIVLRCLKNVHAEKKFSIKILRSEAPPLVQFFAKLPNGNYTAIINVMNGSNDFTGMIPVN